jgi:hypothetical protein
MDPFEVVPSLSDSSRAGPKALKDALSLAGENHMNVVVSFLAFLGQEKLNKGTAKADTAKCYQLVFGTPGLLQAVKEAIEEGRVENTAAVLWFLVGVSRTNPKARENEDVRAIARLLSTDPCPAMAQLATLLAPGEADADAHAVQGAMATFDASKIGSLDELRGYQPKHDNDHPTDYRQISIMPTAAELNCTEGESGVQPMAVIQAQGAGNEPRVVAKVLDRQFRLLRADMIAPTKQELHEEVKKHPHERRKLFARPQVVGWGVKPKASILVRAEMTLALKGTRC